MKKELLITISILLLSCVCFTQAKRGKTEFMNYKRRLLKHVIKNTHEKYFAARRNLQTVSNPYVILVSPKTPMITCTIGDYFQSNFSGFTFDVWGLLISELGWDPSSYVFECVTPTELLTRMENADNVTLGDGAIRITPDLMKQNFKFAQPYYQSSLNVIIRKNVSRNMWSFLSPISVEAGLGLIVTTIIVGIFMWIFEERHWKRPYKEHILNIFEVLYDAFSSYYETNSIELKTVAARIIQWTFWFNIIIFVALYQADLTGQLSSDYYTQDFNSYQEGVAMGKLFGTLDYVKDMPESIIMHSNMVYYNSSGDFNQTIMQMFTDLTNGVLDGVVIDEPYSIYYGSQFCNLLTLDDPIYQFNYGIIFPSNASNDLINPISLAITKILETQQLRLFKKQAFEAKLNTNCNSGETKISMNELAGLWIILAVTIGIALIIYIIKRLKLINMPEHYMPPYYQYFTPKTLLFENQLKEAVEFEVGKILASYQDQIMEEIDNFERSLLLQEEKPGAKDDLDDVKKNDDKRWSLFKVKSIKDNSFGDMTPKTTGVNKNNMS